MEGYCESALFEPWILLPAQVGGGAQWSNVTSGVPALMLAVLEEAVRCIERGRRRRHPRIRKLAAEAEVWVRSDSREWPFAFGSICDVLGLDVDAARARLLATGNHLTSEEGHRSAVWRIGTGPGRTAVCVPRRAARAA